MRIEKLTEKAREALQRAAAEAEDRVPPGGGARRRAGGRGELPVLADLSAASAMPEM